MIQTTTVDAQPDLGTEDGLRTMLVSALDEEVDLLDGLRKIFVVQREALAAGDPRALDDGIFAATRVMRTMEEARRRRRRLTERLIGGDIDFEELDVWLTGPRNRPIRSARDRVQAAASALRKEVALLHRILKTALSDNRRYLEILLGDTTRPVASDGYGAAHSGAVLDRTV